MRLEELAWVWIPIVSSIRVWGVWTLLSLKQKVRTLRARLEALTSDEGNRSDEEREVRKAHSSSDPRFWPSLLRVSDYGLSTRSRFEKTISYRRSAGTTRDR